MGILSKIFGIVGKPKTERFKAPSPPSQAEVAAAEKTLSLSFPTSFIQFMSACGEMELPLCAKFYWIGTGGSDDIVNVNDAEHADAGSPLPSFLIAFYNDGMGNQLCFDTRNRAESGEYPVVFWDHELDPQENLEAAERTAANSESTGIVASSFPEWLKKLRGSNE